MPIETIASALAGVSTGRDIAKWIFERLKKDPEAAEKISAMQSILFGLQSSLIDANDKIIELSADLAMLKERLNYRGKLVRRSAYYEFAEPMEGYGQGPFCLFCTDVNQFPVSVPVDLNGHFHCSKCNASGYLEGKKPPAPKKNNYREEFRHSR